jgi:WD40 repeat protein
LLACAGDDGSIKLWRLEGEHWLAERKLLDGHLGPVNSVAFHPVQSDILLSAGDDGTVNLWQRAADEWMSKALDAENAGKGPARQAIFSPADDNNPVVILTVADNSVKIWSEGGEFQDTLDHERPVQCVAVSPKREWIVTGVGSEALVWDAATHKRLPMTPLGGHSAEITSLAFSPDSERLFTASQDSNVKLWDTKPWSIAAETKKVQLNDAEEAIRPVSRELLTLEQHTDSVVSVCFFASKTYPSLLTAGADGQAILWPSVDHAK